MIVTIGYLLLDVIVRLSQPLADGADADAVTQLGPGGQAANVAAWVAELGGEARFVGKLAKDDAGVIAAQGLERYGVDVRGPTVQGRTGTVVSLVAADGSRTMASDRGVSPDLRTEEVDTDWVLEETLHVPVYSLVREPIATAALRAAELAEFVSVDLSSWSVIQDFGPDRLRARLEALDPDVVFANEAEEEAIGGRLGRALWIVKLGARGARFGNELLPALPADVVDTTGAGDAFAAGWHLGGAELALEAAARCVAKLGSMP